MKTLIVLAGMALLLTGCRNETASFMASGDNDHAVTLELRKPYPWSDWELELIVRNNPDCQRRHTLKPTTEESPKVELYTPEPYVFIVRQAKRWYVTDGHTCQLQQLKEPPPLPGDLVGTFQEKDGSYRFIAAPAAGQKK